MRKVETIDLDSRSAFLGVISSKLVWQMKILFSFWKGITDAMSVVMCVLSGRERRWWICELSRRRFGLGCRGVECRVSSIESVLGASYAPIGCRVSCFDDRR